MPRYHKATRAKWSIWSQPKIYLACKLCNNHEKPWMHSHTLGLALAGSRINMQI